MIAGFVRRARARRRLSSELAIFYHSAYAPRSMIAGVRIPGLDLLRGELVISYLAGKNLLEPGDVRASPLATIEELLAFHSMEYIEATNDRDTLSRIFGMEPEKVTTDELLASQRRAVGGTIAAAKLVANHERSIVFNLGGGFHHAEPDRGSGFCVYNDVGVAIRELRREGFEKRIAVVDLDFHQGNGTLAGFAGDESVLYFGIEGAVWSKVDFDRARAIQLPSGTGDDAYLAALQGALPAALSEHRPSLVFYVAGNDVLAGDRLGTFALTHRGVLERDRRVLHAVQEISAGLVVTMGGGYTSDAWRATSRFLRYVLTADARIEKKETPSLRSHFARIARELDPLDLSGDDDHHDRFELTAADIDESFALATPERRILDYYGKQGLELVFERYGIARKLRARGFRDLEIVADPSDRSHQIVRLFAKKGTDSPRFLLVEMVLAQTTLPAPEGLEPHEPLRLLRVEWLLLQDPTETFSLEKPRLPGQQHPGLGISAEASELFRQACVRLNLDGVLNRPAHYHTGFLGHRVFYFFDPRVEGRKEAMIEVLKELPLAEASTLAEKRALRLVDGTAVPWDPQDYILPTSDRLKRWFASSAYREAVEEARESVLAAGLTVHETT
jgi:acetoin utilization deacetylase AcuC-like enzyme